MIIHFASLNRITAHWYEPCNTQSCLITDLHAKGFIFVTPRRFQSDPLRNRFAQYRQMSGWRFLVSLREVKSSEKILLIRSLIKENINFWNKKSKAKKQLLFEFIQKIAYLDTELQSVNLDEDSTEFAYTIAGHAAKKKLIKRLKCSDCQSSLVGFISCGVED